MIAVDIILKITRLYNIKTIYKENSITLNEYIQFMNEQQVKLKIFIILFIYYWDYTAK